MALQSLFSTSPSVPLVNTYDPAKPNAPYAYALSRTYGGTTSVEYPSRFGDQIGNDEIILGYDAVPLADQDLGLAGGYQHQRCTIITSFVGANVTVENQYLLVFGLRAIHWEPSVQFFIGNELVDTNLVTGDEQHALLLDCPGPGIWVEVIARLASPNWWAAMGFRGVDCHLL